MSTTSGHSGSRLDTRRQGARTRLSSTSAREDQPQHPSRVRSHDDIEATESQAPDPSGPPAFTPRVRSTAFPPRFRPPTNIPKYDGETNPALWLEDYRLACQAGGANDDRFIIRHLPLFLADSARTWLEHLPANQIDGWADLKRIFVGNFQGTYTRPGNPWDLRNCRQNPGETLREYIRCFSRQCNGLPDVGDAEVIGAFLSGTTSKALVHKLGRKRPRTTKELLDIATSHAAGEEAVGALFPRATEARGKRNQDAGEGPSEKLPKKNKQRQRPGQEVVAATGRPSGRAPTGEAPDHFEKMWNGPCPNHQYPVPHLYKECSLMRKFLKMEDPKGNPKGRNAPASRDAVKGEEGGFPEPDGCLMIIPGPEARGSQRSAKLSVGQCLQPSPQHRRSFDGPRRRSRSTAPTTPRTCANRVGIPWW